MFKTYYEVVSVSKDAGKVVFRCTQWFNKDETLDKIEVDCMELEIVRAFKVECSRTITVKTNKEFTVGQKFSDNEFYALTRRFCGNIEYGDIFETGNVVGGNIENRVVFYDSEYDRTSEKIETDDIKKLIGFMNKMIESSGK